VETVRITAYLHNGSGNTVSGNTITGTSGYGIHVYDERKSADDPQTFIPNALVETIP
jgi:parallel beta-helix repeat protein